MTELQVEGLRKTRIGEKELVSSHASGINIEGNESEKRTDQRRQLKAPKKTEDKEKEKKSNKGKQTCPSKGIKQGNVVASR